MTDRMIPAAEARETLSETVTPTTNLAWSDEHVRDLAATVIAQAAQIERLQAALRDADRRTSTELGATWEEDFPMLNEGDMDDDRDN